MAPDVDIKVVAARTAGFAGADLANLVNEAALLAARNGKTGGRDEGLRGGDRPARGRAREETRDEHERAGNRGVSRIGPRHRRQRAARTSTRCTRSRSCSAGSARSATRCSCARIATDDRARSTEPARGAARRTHGRRDRARRNSTGAHNDLQRATDIARAMVTDTA